MERCGIDVATKSSSICVTDGRGAVMLERVVTTDEGGLREALSAAEDGDLTRAAAIRRAGVG